MNNLIISDSKIRVGLQIALILEIYPAIRMVVYKYEADKKRFTLRFYLDREPTEEDYENVSTVMTEFISNFHYSTFDKLIEECIYSDLPQSQLDPLDGIVYARKED